MTTEEAVWFLRDWRGNIPEYNIIYGRLQDNFDFLMNVYADSLSERIIHQMFVNPGKPIEKIVREIRNEMDNILAESDDDHFQTHRYAGIMERLAADILHTLIKKEEQRKDEYRRIMEEPD